jgi:3'(2'), 5'-bisphosphate nucleotidase
MRDRVALLREVRSVAEDAADIALSFYGRDDLAVAAKEDESPVTAADRATSDFICQRLSVLTAGIPIISEEGAAEDIATLAPEFWLVDPLDGTKEFIRRTGEFTINIALVENGRAVIGVVHVPVNGRSYLAAAGHGAARADRGGPENRIRSRAVDASNIVVVASRDHAGPQVAAMLRTLPGATTASMGSSLKFCLVAEGAADVYLRDIPTMEWDTAAAHCVVEAAGGGITTLEGEPLRYGKPSLRNPGLLTFGDTSYPWSQHLS